MTGLNMETSEELQVRSSLSRDENMQFPKFKQKTRFFQTISVGVQLRHWRALRAPLRLCAKGGEERICIAWDGEQDSNVALLRVGGGTGKVILAHKLIF